MNASPLLFVVVAGWLLLVLIAVSPGARYTFPVLVMGLLLALRLRLRQAWALWRVWTIFVRLPADQQARALALMERESGRLEEEGR